MFMIGIERRVGDGCQAAGRMNQRHCLINAKSLLADVRRLAGSDQRVERFIDRRDVAAFDERTGDVRPPHRSAGSELLDTRGLDVVAERAKPFHHPPPARLPRFAESSQAALDALIERIESVGEDVHVDSAVLAGQLHAGNQREAMLIRVRLDLEIGGEIVVIADGDNLDPGRARDIDDLARRPRAIRVMGVSMKIGVTQSATSPSKLS